MDFQDMIDDWTKQFLAAEPIPPTKWQSLDVSDKPEMATREIDSAVFGYDIPPDMGSLIMQVQPSLPWAEDHFLERVGGEPLNPPPSAAYWPYAQQHHKDHVDEGQKFSHTYPERFWPKYAETGGFNYSGANRGIRYPYGDLDDVVNQLVKDPNTRQAYLPVWFPEDTGAVHGERVPCTLGYHFIIRGGKLRITYFIRSCDFLRHFRDDVYMACRLAQWVCQQIAVGSTQRIQVEPSRLIMHIVNFHVFEGDVPRLTQMKREAQLRRAEKLMSAF